MIDTEMIDITKNGNMHLKDINFKCWCCGCEFSCALKHIIEDANKEPNCEQLRCRHVIDEYPSLEDDKLHWTIYIDVPCPECACRITEHIYYSFDYRKSDKDA